MTYDKGLMVYAMNGLLIEAEKMILNARQMIEACGQYCVPCLSGDLMSLACELQKIEEKLQDK